MWVNPNFEASHRKSSLEMVRENPLATIIVGDPVRVSHMPVLLIEKSSGALELVGHMPRTDPVSDALLAGANTTVVFHGARSYVSPAWYVTPGLPTYNYLVAHLEGEACVMEDPEELRAHLLDLTAVHEARDAMGEEAWTFDQIALARMEKLLPLILGFRIPITRFQAKAKLGQNRPIKDQQSVSSLLATSGDSGDRVIANRMATSSEERIINED